MFIGYQNTNNALEAMKISRFSFYLTGSRYFGNSQNSSDIDFFAAKEPGLEEFLQDIGFKKVTSRYHDMLTECVFRHYSGVDVQVCKMPKLKEDVQRRFLKMGIFNPSKTQWEFAFKLLTV